MQNHDPARGNDRAPKRRTSDRSQTSWTLPNQGELFADPAANVIWPALTALKEGTLHDVLREIQLLLAVPRYRDTPQRVREARAVSALREAFELLQSERAGADAHSGGDMTPPSGGDGHLHMTVDDYTR